MADTTSHAGSMAGARAAPMIEAADPAPAPWRRWGVLGLLALGVLIAYVDRISISSALAVDSFNTHFELTDIDRGWVNAAFFWSFAAMQIPIGWIVDRYGVKWPYTICFGLWCAATAITGLIDTAFMLIFMRLLVGAAESVVMPASYRWIRNNFDESQNGTAAGILAMGNKFGPAIGAPVATWLIVTYDWRFMFLLTGTLGILWLIPWTLSVKSDLPKGDAALDRKRAASTVSFGSIFASPLIWGTLIVNFAYSYFTYFCMTWMPSYLVEQRGLSLQSSSLYTFFSFAGIAIVAVIAGWAADRLIARGYDKLVVRKSFVIAGFLGACTVLLGANTGSLGLALFWNVFSLSSLGLATANNLALCRLTLIPAPAVGRVTSIQQVAASLAGGAAASISGLLLHLSGSYQLPMLVIFVFLLIGAAATLLLLNPKWAPRVE